MKCFLGIHKPKIKSEPTEDKFYVSVRCERCGELLDSDVLAVDVIWVREREAYGFQVGIVKVQS